MSKTQLQTDSAPAAIGTYSQGIRVGNTLYLSGQIPLDPKTMELVSDDFKDQTKQVFKNITALCTAAGCDLDSIVKLTVFLTDFAKFPILNEVMQPLFKDSFPARSTVEVSALPKNAQIEIEAIVVMEGMRL